MRKTLVKQLIKQDTEDTYFLTAGVGYGVLEPLREKMGDRFIDVGIAEQSMISIASGLALSGKRVYTYTMCAFYLRAIEQIRNDIVYQEAPVIMIGVGTGFDYGYLGYTHFACEDEEIMSKLGVLSLTPKNKSQVCRTIKQIDTFPYYIRVGYDHKRYRRTEHTKEGGSKEYFIKKYR